MGYVGADLSRGYYIGTGALNLTFPYGADLDYSARDAFVGCLLNPFLQMLLSAV